MDHLLYGKKVGELRTFSLKQRSLGGLINLCKYLTRGEENKEV